MGGADFQIFQMPSKACFKPNFGLFSETHTGYFLFLSFLNRPFNQGAHVSNRRMPAWACLNPFKGIFIFNCDRHLNARKMLSCDEGRGRGIDRPGPLTNFVFL